MKQGWLLPAVAISACLSGRATLPLQPAEQVEAPPEPAAEVEEPSPAEADLAELPPPLPPPDLAAPPAPPPAGAGVADPLDLLWGHRLELSAQGEPLITIGLMGGQREIAFRPRGPGRIALRGGSVVEVPAGVRLVVRVHDVRPARFAWSAVIAEKGSAGQNARARKGAIEALGVAARLRVTGAVYGIGGRVVDTRREQLAVEGDGSEAAARAAVEALRARGLVASLDQEVVERPAGTLELLGPGGAPLGVADTALTLEVEADSGFLVEGVENGLGAARAREDRSYKGRLLVTLDAGGGLTAVHGVPLEELLRGIVPSEMPASAPLEALKAQAVTARSNVMAQVGLRHLADPFMLCAEVHCQAYRGDGARTARTDEAVLATRGEALFGSDDRRLVDGVYSAMCGGYGEDNDTVWGEAPSPRLRGRPDLPPEEARRWAGGLAREPTLRAFLAAARGAYCRLPPARRDRFRWERRLDSSRLQELGEALGVGRIEALRVTSRGVSGRARTLRVEGERGTVELSPELRIRRALGDLPSAMFVIDREGSSLVLRGGGWGHGVGLCQWGAVGRAMTGQGYQEILRAYFAGAEVAKVY
ncbi:MAG TPA: SpoIID/LytB domain-containing protein [Anaeromyxobacter sp.]|nr:SpoIID/LytB domain-containing protein [Anaeromyxobacter sp.]